MTYKQVVKIAQAVMRDRRGRYPADPIVRREIARNIGHVVRLLKPEDEETSIYVIHDMLALAERCEERRQEAA